LLIKLDACVFQQTLPAAFSADHHTGYHELQMITIRTSTHRLQAITTLPWHMAQAWKKECPKTTEYIKEV
jgi:hypothetical protein